MERLIQERSQIIEIGVIEPVILTLSKDRVMYISPRILDISTRLTSGTIQKSQPSHLVQITTIIIDILMRSKSMIRIAVATTSTPRLFS